MLIYGLIQSPEHQHMVPPETPPESDLPTLTGTTDSPQVALDTLIHLPHAFVTTYLDLALSPQPPSLSHHPHARGLAGLRAKEGLEDSAASKGSSWKFNLLSAWAEDGKTIPLHRSSAQTLAPAEEQL